MKTRSKVFRAFISLWSLIILCQSCTIYRSQNISIDEAIETRSKVRVKTTSNQTYIFRKIEKNEVVVYGIADKNSEEGKQLVDQIIPESTSDDKVKIQLRENSIASINPKNKVLSLLVPLSIVIASYIAVGSALLSIAPGK